MSNVPLKGYLADESDREIRVHVRRGTWIIPKSDIETLSDWKDSPGVMESLRPIQVVIKPGSTIGFLQKFVVEPMDRPFTLPAHYSELVGNKDLSLLANEWGLRHGFSIDEPISADGHDTVSCWGEPGGWGLHCEADDSGYPILREI